MLDKDAAKQVGAFFKKARLDMGGTQKDTADAVSITLAQIKQYEAGTVMPRLTTALKLCNFFDVSWAELERVLSDTLHEGEVIEPGSQLSGGASMSSRAQSKETQARSSPQLKLSRPETRAFGRHIVMDGLTEHGWSILETNAAGASHSNYDIKAERDERTIRLKVNTKRHETKTTLSVRWQEGRPTFNLNSDQERADFLVMVRFTSRQDTECFILSIAEAEIKADWVAQEMIKLGNKPMYLQPYTGGPRNSRFTFNSREVWEPYSKAWKDGKF